MGSRSAAPDAHARPFACSSLSKHARLSLCFAADKLRGRGRDHRLQWLNVASLTREPERARTTGKVVGVSDPPLRARAPTAVHRAPREQ